MCQAMDCICVEREKSGYDFHLSALYSDDGEVYKETYRSLVQLVYMADRADTSFDLGGCSYTPTMTLQARPVRNIM